MYFEKQNLPFSIKGTTEIENFDFEVNPAVLQQGIQLVKSESKYINKENTTIRLQQYIAETFVPQSNQIIVCYKNSSV